MDNKSQRTLDYEGATTTTPKPASTANQTDDEEFAFRVSPMAQDATELDQPATPSPSPPTASPLTIFAKLMGKIITDTLEFTDEAAEQCRAFSTTNHPHDVPRRTAYLTNLVELPERLSSVANSKAALARYEEILRGRRSRSQSSRQSRNNRKPSSPVENPVVTAQESKRCQEREKKHDKKEKDVDAASSETRPIAFDRTQSSNI